MKHNTGKGVILEIISGTLFGTIGMWSKLLGGYGFTIVHISLLFSLSFILINGVYMLICKREGFRITGRQLIVTAILGAVFVNGLKMCFFYAASVLPVGICAAVQFCMVFPLMIVSRILFKERITAAKIIYGVLCVFGVCLVFNVFSRSGTSYPVLGIAMMLLSMSFAVFQTTIYNVLIRQNLNVTTITFYFSIFAFLSLFIVTYPTDASALVIDRSSIPIMIGFAVSNVLCINFLVAGLKYITPTMVGIVQAFDPVAASVVGAIVLNEVLSISQFFGIGLIIACVIGVTAGNIVFLRKKQNGYG